MSPAAASASTSARSRPTLPMHRERPLPGLGAGLDGLQLGLLLLHRPGRPRTRAEPAAGRGRSPRSTRLARGRRPRADAARPERQLVRPRPRARDRDRVRRAPARLRRRRRHRAHPLHEPAPEGLPRARDRGDRRVRRPSASTSTCRSSPARLADPEGDAPHLHARALPRARRPAARSAIPDLALGTDIIVGFPGETEADFEQTLEVVAEVGFDSAFTFVYSPRQGTEAADAWPSRSPHELKIERMERLVELTQRLAAERNAARVGRVEEVLVEGPSRTDETVLRGRTRRNTTVNFTGEARPGRARRGADRAARPRPPSAGARRRSPPSAPVWQG